MSTTRHMRLDVAGALANGHGWKWVTGADGRPVKKRDAVRWLLARLSEGKRFLPIGECDNFDDNEGCLGHPGSEPR